MREGKVQHGARSSLTSPWRRRALHAYLFYPNVCLLGAVRRASNFQFCEQQRDNSKCAPASKRLWKMGEGNSPSSLSVVEDLIRCVVTLLYKTVPLLLEDATFGVDFLPDLSSSVIAARVLNLVHWLHLSLDVRHHAQNCQVCQLCKLGTISW